VKRTSYEAPHYVVFSSFTPTRNCVIVQIFHIDMLSRISHMLQLLHL